MYDFSENQKQTGHKCRVVILTLKSTAKSYGGHMYLLSACRSKRTVLTHLRPSGHSDGSTLPRRPVETQDYPSNISDEQNSMI